MNTTDLPVEDVPAAIASPAQLLLDGSPPLLVVVSGPSGVGKDAVLLELKRRGSSCHFTVTATTRPPRQEECDGVDYYFLSAAEFDRLIATDGLLEHEQYENGCYYGVPRGQVKAALASGQDVIVRTDVRGARSIKRLAAEAILIFLYPPSLDSLRRRMQQRNSESAASLQRRLALADTEIAAAGEFTYMVRNEDGALDRAVDQVEAICTAERCRIGRRPVTL